MAPDINQRVLINSFLCGYWTAELEVLGRELTKLLNFTNICCDLLWLWTVNSED